MFIRTHDVVLSELDIKPVRLQLFFSLAIHLDVNKAALVGKFVSTLLLDEGVRQIVESGVDALNGV